MFGADHLIIPMIPYLEVTCYEYVSIRGTVVSVRLQKVFSELIAAEQNRRSDVGVTLATETHRDGDIVTDKIELCC